MSAEKVSGFTTWIESWVLSQALPGAMAGIYDRNGTELFFYAADNHSNGGARYSRDALFRIYSMTKPITSVAVMILVERGVLSLQDEVSKWIPSFANLSVCTGGTVDAPEIEPLKEPLRLIHLLTHTSGISYAFFGNNIPDQILRKKLDPDWQNWFHYTDIVTLCDKIAETPLCFQPGTCYHYGLSTDVVGRVIEVASGQKLSDFFREHIFEPLEMHDTSFQVMPDQAHRLVEVFEIAPGHTYKPSVSPERDRMHKPVLEAAGGGLVSSISDYSKFSTFLLRGGESVMGRRLLSEESVRVLSSNQLTGGADLSDFSFEKGFSESVGPGFGFGLNVSVLERPEVARGGRRCGRGEYGWGGVAGTSFAVDPVHGRSAIFFTSLIGAAVAYPIRPAFRNLSHWFFDDEEVTEN